MSHTRPAVAIPDALAAGGHDEAALGRLSAFPSGAPTAAPTDAADALASDLAARWLQARSVWNPRRQQMESKSLFERLGGSSGITALVEDIVALHMENPVIRARFRPILETPEKLAVTKKHLCAFLEAGSGGRAQYTGRSMRDAHRGMNVSEAEYMAATDDILATLRKHSIDEQSQKDVLAIAYSLKQDILHV
jgi:hemoglobin